MNEEIKEILSDLIKWYDIAQEDFKPLLNYITNLEEENEDLKDQVDYQDLWRKEYIDRIDKAIEYIEKEYNEYNREFDSYQIWLEDLLNILKGE